MVNQKHTDLGIPNRFNLTSSRFNGKIVGGETIKPTLKSLPKADADAIRPRMEQP